MQSLRHMLMAMVAILAGILALTGSSQAGYPNKPVTILVGFPAGGPTDLGARALAKAAEPFFPQPMTVVNKPGGGSVLATNEVVHARPDGYTLGGILNNTLTVSPHLSLSLPYKGPDDITPLMHYLGQHLAFNVRADSPFKTAQEMIAYAKANPGKLRIAHSGLGSATHILLESLVALGVPLTMVPMEGAAPVMMALLGGHVDGLVLNIGPVLPHIRAGKFRYLAVFAEEREKVIPELANVPTFKEVGYNVLTDCPEYYISAPNGTPKAVTDMLYEALVKAAKSPTYQSFLGDNGFQTPGGTAEIRKVLNESYKFYKEFLPKIGLKPQK